MKTQILNNQKKNFKIIAQAKEASDDDSEGDEFSFAEEHREYDK